MHILGISAYYHDSAACLVQDGAIVAAAQEERFTRKKFDARFPARSIRYCLDEEGISLDDVQYVVFYDKPLVKFERLLETAFGHVMGWINTRILLGLLFYGVVTPLGIFRGWLGKDPMGRRLPPELESYRVPRNVRSARHLRRQY